MPRLLTRLTWFVLLAVCIAGLTGARAQEQAPTPSPPESSSAAEPKFEVASVKKSGPMPQGGFRFGMMPGGGSPSHRCSSAR